jgi:hypothetical protein
VTIAKLKDGFDLFSLNRAPRSNISRISKYSSVYVCDRAASCCLLRCRGTIISEPSRDQALLSLGVLAQPSALQGNSHPSKNKQTDDYLLIIGDGAAGLVFFGRYPGKQYRTRGS